MLTQQQPPSSSFELLGFPVSVLRLKAKLPKLTVSPHNTQTSDINCTVSKITPCMKHIDACCMYLKDRHCAVT